MRDIYNNITVEQAQKPATATNNVTSAAIDLQGYDSLAVLFDIGQSGDTLSTSVYWTLKLQESDDNSSYTDVSASDLHNSAATIVVDDPAEDETVLKFGYKGGKRYVKGLAVKSGTHTNGTPIGIIAVKSKPANSPVA